MNKEEQIEFIKEKCIEANPEIVELKFGCEVRIKTFQRSFVVLSGNSADFYGIYAADEHLNEGGRLWDFSYKGIRKIIGRDIRLADVLLTLDVIKCLKISSCLGIVEVWNLKDDNLNNQSDETVEFIYNLLKS